MDLNELVPQVKEAIQDIAGIDDRISRELEIKKMSGELRVGVQAIREEVELAVRKRQKELVQSLSVAGKKEIDIGGERRISDIFTDVANVASASGKMFIYGKNFSIADQSGLNMTTDAGVLNGKLSSICDFTRLVEGKNGPRKVFSLLPNDMSLAFLQASVLEVVPEIEMFFRRATLDLDYKLIPPGYHASSKIFVAAAPITPRKGIETLRMGLKDFCFESKADFANYLAFMLTSLVHHHFASRVPIMLMKGNQPSVGKGEAVECLSIIREGKEERNITFIGNEEELEKRICSVLKSGSSMVKFDNVKTTDRFPLIESATVERLVTDSAPSFRILGTNTDLHFPKNTIQVTMTYNGGEMSMDLISRSVPVMLTYEGDPAKRKFMHKDVRKFFRENRMAILGELLGMVDVWIAGGKKLAQVQHRMQDWAEHVGGIIEANGIEGFLSNLGGFQREADPYLEDLSELLNIWPVGKKMTASELLALGKGKKLFQRDFVGDTTPAQKSQFGKFLSRYAKREISVFGDVRSIQSKPERHSTVYWWVSVREIKEPTPHENPALGAEMI